MDTLSDFVDLFKNDISYNGNYNMAPTSPKQFILKSGDFNKFSDLLDKYHYKQSKIGGSISYHLILEYKDIVFGGIVIGKMRHSDKYDENAFELRRMVLHPCCPKNTASFFISKIIKWLKENTDISILYTFADTSVGHVGTCYKAANFIFVKETPPTNHVLWKGKRYHMRSLTIERPYSHELREALKNGNAIIEKGKPKLLFKYIINRKEHKKGNKTIEIDFTDLFAFPEPIIEKEISEDIFA